MTMDRNNTSYTATPDTTHLRVLQAIREQELRFAMKHFPAKPSSRAACKVLEIGAGTGHQAKQISDFGYEVTAIDLTSSYYRPLRVFDVTDYDGKVIPAHDSAFDVVFSSNVLEHVADIDGFLEEARRVMAKGGIAVNILPTGSCRLWSIPAHYIWLVKRIFAALKVVKHATNEKVPAKPHAPATLTEWLGILFPLRHGERGNTLTEIYYFSQHWWTRKFCSHGFKVVKAEPNRLFYTMANSMTDSIRLDTRSKLSRILGSACTIYVLEHT